MSLSVNLLRHTADSPLSDLASAERDVCYCAGLYCPPPMAPFSRLLLLLQLLCWTSAGLACFCERYPWGSWSACSSTCNHGVQHRDRNVQYSDGYYWKYSCHQLCKRHDSRSCNEQRCPINCLLTEFGPWSICSPCVQKQFRTRSVLRPSQFEGSACSVELTEERPCHAATECKLADVDCREQFKCDNGRCVNTTLTCNSQNDCGDNSDERDCRRFTVVCPREMRPTPGVNLVGNGFDALAEEPRGAVLDNMFMGGTCTIKRPNSTNLYHRIPYNFQNFDIKVAVVDDFNTELHPLKTETIELPRTTTSSSSSQGSQWNLFIPIFFFGGRSKTHITSSTEAFEASKKIDSKFVRVHQVLPVSTFEVRDQGDLVLSLPFLQHLTALPLEYSYAMYRDLLMRFGTHYIASGKLGGQYDLLYQYNREDLSTAGETSEHVTGCLSNELTFSVILYSQHSSVRRCRDNRMTEKHGGSYAQAAEKSFSLVRGGRAREAAALAWERKGPAPDRTSYKNWAGSIMDNPALIETKALPILDLVRGIPCAVTKRRHLRRALLQYMDEFDSCKCAPCPNNARPVLSGTECKCVCQTGTFGRDCEKRAPDFTSEEVDGYWSCWGPWSSCGATMKRHRTRRCNNPAPIRGGQPCDGPHRQEDTCHVRFFERQESCDNDNDYTIGLRIELPPGVEGCLRPESPANSFLRKAKPYYFYGEEDEFQCYVGFDLEGFQFINCLPGGVWSQPQGECLRKVCLPPDLPDGMTVHPMRDEYRVGQSVGFSCDGAGLVPVPSSRHTCGQSLTWDPPLPEDLRCSDVESFVPDGQCRPGQRLQAFQCVCIQQESCLSQPENLCILNVGLGLAVSMSLCSFQAGLCHSDPLFFIHEGACDPADVAKVEWAKFRASLASKSSIRQPCGLDTCYEWETCSAVEKCDCLAARDCPSTQGKMFCVKLTRSQRTRTLDLCSLASLKCSSYQLEVLNEGDCPSK